ncbi:MAG: hypothetical protein Q4C06_00430 [Bacillota bacterium]|nr:hypothetical protein [Bacillota bacterium]
MKKYLMIIGILLAVFLGLDYLYYYDGDLFFSHEGEVTCSGRAAGEQLYIDKGTGYEVFDIRGVNLGLGKPGYFATEMAITKEEYLEWMKQIQEMGANVLRIYTIGPTAFYDAFYEYNLNNPEPLYLIHGVWVDDYLLNSSYSAMDEAFYQPFLEECKDTVDVIHGRYKMRGLGGIIGEKYDKDISRWVYGYIPGVEWEPTLVTYTDEIFEQLPQYKGEYFYTEEASNFEILLAGIGNEMVSYETQKYGTQRMIGFSNWVTTDPLEYQDAVEMKFKKSAAVDVEHIKTTEKLLSGQFASYHIYPYYPDYFSFYEDREENTYLQYLNAINAHHSMPVVVTEFGVPSSRGMAAYEDLGRNQGCMSEQQQGEALISMYEDIKAAGSAGGIVFIWQDEWFKRTWNTMAATELETTAYWSNYQTNEQYFGLLSFDPGEEESICYVDGDRSDWDASEVAAEQDGYRLSVKYDEKFLYFLVEKDGLDIQKDRLYLPIDTTPKSGAAKTDQMGGLEMEKPADFVIEINGTENSRVWVQEYYDMIRALYSNALEPQGFFAAEFPRKDSGQFNPILLLLQRDSYYESIGGGEAREISFAEYNPLNSNHYMLMESYETGKLLYGNANPKDSSFCSLADFCSGEGFVEIKLPWHLLNFADPSTMRIHDDYYEVYGVEYLRIDEMMVGVGDGSRKIEMAAVELEKLGKHPKYHERLKESYYILQDYWSSN